MRKLSGVIMLALCACGQSSTKATPHEIEVIRRTQEQIEKTKAQLELQFERMSAPMVAEQAVMVNTVCGRAGLNPGECNIDFATGNVTKKVPPPAAKDGKGK